MIDNNPLNSDELAKLEIAIFTEQKRLLNYQISLEQHYKENQLLYFQPNRKQTWFFENADRKRRSGFCGNRFGKSTVGVVEDCCWLLGYRPFYPEGNPLRYLGIPDRGVKGLVIAEDWDKVKEIFTNYDDPDSDRIGKFFEYLPKWCIEGTDKDAKGRIVGIRTKSEVHGRIRRSVVMFDTVQAFKKNPRAFESSDWDFIHCDEPLPKALWNAASRGLIDRGGSAWWLMTPLTELWMYTYMKKNAELDPMNFWSFVADMADNPLNSPSEIALYLSQLDEDERKCREEGLPLAFGSLVYGKFSKDQVIKGAPPKWDSAVKPPPDWMIVYIIDTHPQTPHAVTFFAVSPNGYVHLYDELYQKGSLEDLAKAIKFRTFNRRACYVLCEPAAFIEDQTTGLSYSDRLWELGIPVEKSTKEKTHGITLTKDFITSKGNEGEFLFRVHEHCGRFLFEIENYVFDKENKPIDKDDHMMECLYRGVYHDNFNYHNPNPVSKPIEVKDNLMEFDLSLPAAQSSII